MRSALMAITAAIVVVTGCAKKRATCPTADELARGSGVSVTRRELELVAGHCIADGWSTGAITCLRAASDDEAMEGCFRMLTAEQQASLKAVLGHGDREETTEQKRDKHLAFLRTLADEPFDPVFRSSPECAEYRAAITSTSEAIVKCDKLDLLEQYGMQQTVLATLRDLVARPVAQRAAECTSAAAELRAMPELACR